MLAAIAWLTLAVVILLVALLAIPLEVRFALRRRQTLQGRVHVTWLFGRVRAGGGESRRREKARDAEEPSRRDAPVPWKSQRARLRRLVAVARTPGLASRLLRLSKQLVASVQLEAEGEGRFGLEDPADTGRVYGALAAVTAWLPAPVAGSRIEPDFSGPRLEFELRGRARIVPLRSLGPLIAFLVSPAALRAAWRAARAGGDSSHPRDRR